MQKILPEDAFGKRDVELLHDVAIDELPPNETLEIGGRIVGQNESGGEIAFIITAIEDGIVSLDGNHPLAGLSLLFEIEIQGIGDATAAEISAGEANTPE